MRLAGRWRRRGAGWLASCRDIAGRRGAVLVLPLADGRVALVVPPGEVAVLNLLAVGRLRGALRDAGRAVDDPLTASLHWHAVPLSGMSA